LNKSSQQLEVPKTRSLPWGIDGSNLEDCWIL
jgi:hypothetical protein